MCRLAKKNTRFDADLCNLTYPYTVMITPSTRPYSIFFDDASRHFTAECVAILGLKVDSGGKRSLSTHNLSPDAAGIWKKYNFHQTYDSKSGVQQKTFHLLCDICKSCHIQSILFDWDKTLSVHSGLNTSAKPSYYVAECYFGGADRMKAMKSFFRLAHSKRWDIRILTSNPVAESNKHYFQCLLETVCAGWVSLEYVPRSKIEHVGLNEKLYGLCCKCAHETAI